MSSQVNRTGETRIRKHLSIFGLISCWGSGLFIKTPILFGIVSVRERLHIVRYEEFDSGWTYQNYWGRPHRKWCFEEFI